MSRPASDERLRAARAVASRITELHTTVRAVALRAGVDQRTVRGLIDGIRWPNTEVRERICKALNWPTGEIVRRAQGRPELREFTSVELLDELRRRATLCPA